MQAVFGGSKYTILNKTEVGFRKLEHLAAESKLPYASRQMTDAEIVAIFSKEIDMDKLVIHFLGQLHNELAKIYLDIIDRWSKANDPSSIGLVESKEDRPANYTPEMRRLKNISWIGLNHEFKGFCVLEPITRIMQLITYPIDKFATIVIVADDIKLPTKPIIPESQPAPVTIERIRSLRPHFEAREKWLAQLCTTIDTIIEKIKTATSHFTEMGEESPFLESSALDSR